MQPNRVPIWSVLDEDQRWYAWLFPGIWLLGTLYHAYLRFRVDPEESLVLTIGEFTKDIGIVGLSAAILALMVIAARRLGMALFDWANKDKTRAETRAETDKEWEMWIERRDAAIKDGRPFNEPPPSKRRREAPVS